MAVTPALSVVAQALGVVAQKLRVVAQTLGAVAEALGGDSLHTEHHPHAIQSHAVLCHVPYNCVCYSYNRFACLLLAKGTHTIQAHT